MSAKENIGKSISFMTKPMIVIWFWFLFGFTVSAIGILFVRVFEVIRMDPKAKNEGAVEEDELVRGSYPSSSKKPQYVYSRKKN